MWYLKKIKIKSEKKNCMLNAMKLHLATTLLWTSCYYWHFLVIKLTTSLLISTLQIHVSFAFTVHSETPQLKVRTVMKLRQICMISLTLFEMNCWFLCDQGHVINRPPTMQISLLEWTDSQIRRPAIRKSENYKYVANNQTFKKELNYGLCISKS